MKLRILAVCALSGLAASAYAETAATPASTQAAPAASTVPAPVMPVQPKDAKVLKDGLAYKVLEPGKGKRHPKLTDSVTANYSLWKADGTFLESTCTAGKCDPATFPLDKLIPGWQEMIPMMIVGEKVNVWLPVQLAYGDPPRKPNRPFGPLVFTIELIDIGRPLPPPEPETK